MHLDKIVDKNAEEIGQVSISYISIGPILSHHIPHISSESAAQQQMLQLAVTFPR